MSKLFSGDFNSLACQSELTRLILYHFVPLGTAFSSQGTCPSWPRPHDATDRDLYICLCSPQPDRYQLTLWDDMMHVYRLLISSQKSLYINFMLSKKTIAGIYIHA